MEYFYDAVGSTSAGVLGYITAGSKGAKKSIGAFNSFQKRMKRKSSGPPAAPRAKRIRSLRLTPKNTGKARRLLFKRPNNKKRTMKAKRSLNTRIRKIAIKAIHGEQPTGKYVKNVLYNLPNSIGGSNLLTQTVVNTALYQGSTTHDGSFAVGTYSKLVDALSILWGSKTAGFYSTTGDLSTAGMIVPYISHKARYEFVNNTLVTQVMLIYECCTKEDTNASVYSNWAACSVVQKGGTTRSITFQGMRPEYYPQFREQYTYKKKEFRLLPGKRLVISHSVSKNHLNFDQWAPIGGGTNFTYRKNFTKELLILNWNAVTVGYGYTSGSRPAIVTQVTGGAPYTIGVHMTDIITCKIPENVDVLNNDDNTLCVWNQYDQDIATSDANTVVTPSISQITPYQ